MRAWERAGRNSPRPVLQALPYPAFALPPTYEKKIRKDAAHILTTTEFGRRYKDIVSYW